MAVQKQVRITYQAKNNATGLTDVKAQVYLNGVAKATGVGALVLTELDPTNSPGIYELVLSAANLTSYGVLPTQYNEISGSINSVTQQARAPFRVELTVASNDDLDTKLGTPAGASVAADIAGIQTKLGSPAGATVSADIAAIKADTAAVKIDLESGGASLATILSNIQALQNASIGNGVGFVIPTMLIPPSGSNTYSIPITIQNDLGALVDPATNSITVGVKNAAGVDRGSFLTGSAGSPATVLATRTSAGQYVATVVIPSTEVEEELIFSFAYTIGSNPMVRFGVSQTVNDAGASGYALQSTLLATQTTVGNINSAVTNATYGLSALQTLLADGTNGLAAIKTVLVNGTYGLSALQALLANGTYGLSALQALLTNGTYGLAALQTQAAATQGVGFVAGTDDLHSLSAFVRANIYSGGKAV